jgi:hypothetical protein
MEEEQRRADEADADKDEAEEREAREEADRIAAEKERDEALARANGLADQLHDAHEQLADLLRSLRGDDRERKVAIDLTYAYLDKHAPGHAVERPAKSA